MFTVVSSSWLTKTLWVKKRLRKRRSKKRCNLVQGLDIVKTKLNKGDAFLIFTSADASAFNSLIVKLLRDVVSKKHSPVVYLCIDKPFRGIKRLLDKEHIDSSAIIFIDAVTLMTGNKGEGTNCRYLRSPENLTDMSIALSEAVSSLSPSKVYVIVDSLSTLLLYNKMTTVVKFAHILTAKIKQYGAKGLVMSSKGDSADIFIDQIFKFFDKVIDLSGG